MWNKSTLYARRIQFNRITITTTTEVTRVSGWVLHSSPAAVAAQLSLSLIRGCYSAAISFTATLYTLCNVTDDDDMLKNRW